MTKARLILEDGTTYNGFSFGASVGVAGEVVFQTGMVGYPESLTDPSYKGQLLCLTYPLIGNYGVPSANTYDEFGLPAFFESDRVQVSALIVSECCEHPSHFACKQTLSEYLMAYNVPGISGIDTRALTKKIREQGTMLGKIVVDGQPEVPFDDPNRRNLVAEASCTEVKEYNPDGKKTVVAIDCGIKYNQIRCLARCGFKVRLVPWNHDVKKETFDALCFKWTR
jgi:carbamoyl-phosphate synthase/aspartate carbamoyltransferase/dihydroorotase